MIIDIHAHLWRTDPVAEDFAEARNLIRMMDLGGIDRAYISSVTGGYYPTPGEIERANLTIARSIAKFPDRLGGVVYVNPANPDTIDVLKRGFEEQGMEMIKLWVATFADAVQVDPVMEYAASIGVPVLFHAFHKTQRVIPSESTGVHIANIARRHPKTKIIMAHFGGNCYDGIQPIRDCPNVWTDYSLSIFGGDAINYAVELLGVDRIVYGSDAPGNPESVNVGKILGADLTEAQREQIFCGNARRLLDRSYRL